MGKPAFSLSGDYVVVVYLAILIAISLAFVALFARRMLLGRVLQQKLALVSTALWGEAGARRIDLERFDEAQILPSLRLQNRKRSRYIKRTLDIVLSLTLLFIMLPLLILVAVLIKLETPGPVFYRQERVGLNGERFKVIKFRSMVNNAEREGARWASKNDVRVTRLGRILRRTRIDEIPQAINVLSGRMSFVGPRPERPEFVSMLAEEIPHYLDRHSVKPGITGWAQVEYSYGASVDDARAKLTYDLYYIQNFSFVLDLVILLKTVRVTLLGVGSR